MGNPSDDIEAAIAAEEQELLRQVGQEPGYFRQLSTIFHGEAAWLNAIMMLSQIVLFIGGIYAGWQFFDAKDTMAALHWGLPGAVLLIMSLMIKLALWPVIQTNRVLLALKRLEMKGSERR